MAGNASGIGHGIRRAFLAIVATLLLLVSDSALASMSSSSSSSRSSRSSFGSSGSSGSSRSSRSSTSRSRSSRSDTSDDDSDIEDDSDSRDRSGSSRSRGSSRRSGSRSSSSSRGGSGFSSGKSSKPEAPALVFGQKFERDGVRPRLTVISASEFADLSCRSEPVAIGTSTYYRCGESWYQGIDHQGWTCYAEIYPPAGARVPSLPDGALAINSEGRTYYATDDAIYVLEPGIGYVVVEPPVGSRLERLPPAATKGIPVVANGASYYRHLGVFYRAENDPPHQTYVVTRSPFLVDPTADAKAADANVLATHTSLGDTAVAPFVSEDPREPKAAPAPGSPRDIFLAH